MIAQKARKTEYKREHFAILRRKRGGEWIVRSYRYNALGMLHAKEATGSNSRTTLEELIAGKEAADDPDGDGQAHLTTYTYDLTQPYYEVLTETTDNVTTAYTYGLERLAAYTEKAQTKYLYDGRGSVIQITSSFGTQTKAYSPFGELLTEKTSGYGFNGEYFDAATGMLNLRARQYEPGQARFSQKDSEKGHVTNARSLNAYLYCYNDGINYFDASGAKPEVVRNNTTVDPGGGGSSARIANEAQSKAAPKKVTTASSSAVGAGHLGNKLTNRERILFDNPEEAARIRYAKKQSSSLTVNSAISRYLCTAISEGFSDPLWVLATGAPGSIVLDDGKVGSTTPDKDALIGILLFILCPPLGLFGCAPPQDSVLEPVTYEEFYAGVEKYIFVGSFYNPKFLWIDGTSYGAHKFQDGIAIAYDKIFNMEEMEYLEKNKDTLIDYITRAALQQYDEDYLNQSAVDKEEHRFSMDYDTLRRRIAEDYDKYKEKWDASDDKTSLYFSVYEKGTGN